MTVGSTQRAVRARGANARATTSNGKNKRKVADRLLDRNGRLKNEWWLLFFSAGFIGGGCLLWVLFLLWLRSGF